MFNVYIIDRHVILYDLYTEISNLKLNDLYVNSCPVQLIFINNLQLYYTILFYIHCIQHKHNLIIDEFRFIYHV